MVQDWVQKKGKNRDKAESPILSLAGGKGTGQGSKDQSPFLPSVHRRSPCPRATLIPLLTPVIHLYSGHTGSNVTRIVTSKMLTLGVAAGRWRGGGGAGMKGIPVGQRSPPASTARVRGAGRGGSHAPLAPNHRPLPEGGGQAGASREPLAAPPLSPSSLLPGSCSPAPRSPPQPLPPRVNPQPAPTLPGP